MLSDGQSVIFFSDAQPEGARPAAGVPSTVVVREAVPETRGQRPEAGGCLLRE